MRAYVFVASGAGPHLQDLAVALPLLRRFTSLPVLVVTDLARTAGLAVPGATVVDVRTPPALDDGAAARWLKTSLHRALDLGGAARYCYLDCDVFAVRPGVDEVFDEAEGLPVAFARDHCVLERFSPWAVACGCRPPEEPAGPADRRERLSRLLACQRRGALRALALRALARLPLVRRLLRSDARDEAARLARRAVLAAGGPEYDRFLDQRGFRWERAEGRYCDRDGTVLLDERRGVLAVAAREALFAVGAAVTLGRNLLRGSPDRLACDHLARAVRDAFGVTVGRRGWRHWNGGVFVFGAEAAPLLDTWHEYQGRIEGDPAWRPRDQGTLAAAAWRHGLQDQRCLAGDYNYLVDYYDARLDFLDGEFVDGVGARVAPRFLHLWDGAHDDRWAVWRWVASRLDAR